MVVCHCGADRYAIVDLMNMCMISSFVYGHLVVAGLVVVLLVELERRATPQGQ
jgi:hypothetical protein